MADINLTSLAQLQPSQGVQSAPTVSQGSSSQTPQVPAQSPGTVLTGFIINRDSSGNPILRTENGDFAFSTNFFLKIGSEVVVRFENIGGATQAHVLSVNGQAPEIAEQQSAFSEEPEVIVSNTQQQTAATIAPTAQTATAAPSAPATSATPTINATLLPTPVSNTADATAPQPVALSLRVLSVNPAPVTTVAVPATPAPATPLQGTQALAAAAYTRASGTPVTTQSSQAATQVPDTSLVLPPQKNMVEDMAQETSVPTAIPTTNTPNVAAPLITIAQASQPAPAVQAQTAAVPTETPQPSTVSAATPAPAPAQALTQGQVITATVLSSDGNGALVQTDAGIVRLQTPVNLPPGSSVQLEVAQVGTPDDAAPTQQTNQPVQAAPLTTLARQWDSLQQIVTLVQSHATSSDPAKQGNVAASINLPSLVASAVPAAAQSAINPQAISAGLMFFLTALRGGDLRNWLGKSNADWLDDQGHGDLLKRADMEFTSIARQYMDTPPGQWRTLFFPIAVEGEWQQVRMFTKRDRKPPKGNAPTAKPDEDTRFVVEITLSQMGDLQMDGLVQRHDKKTVQFDLYIRSLQPVQPDVQKDILQIYNNIGQLTGYKGSLLFQSVKEFPVNPMEEVIAHAMKTVVA